MEGGIALVILLIVYFLPSFVALRRKKSNGNAILVLNLLLGWTLVGWVVSLVWAVSVDKNQKAQKKRRGNKKCPFCFEGIDARATVCPHCQKNLPAGKKTGAKK